MNKRLILELANISKNYQQGKNILQILDKADLKLYEGEMVALVGPSGSGKSTLLHIAGLLDDASDGKVLVEGEDITKASDKVKTELRLKKIGFIYQFHHLLPEFTAIENVYLPLLFAHIDKKVAYNRALELLEILGLKERVHHRPNELSGGEQQRVAIARALINNPSLLLADEPTGNLDAHTSDIVSNLLVNAAKEFKLAGLIVTHNMQVAEKMDRIVTLKEAKLVELKTSSQK